MKRKIILISAVLIFLAAPSAFAQKSQEKDDMSLFEIDRLIRRTEYDEALRQLNIYIEKNPEKFDNAQTRIKRIMHARNQYSILAEKLIKLIQTDPGNNKERAEHYQPDIDLIRQHLSRRKVDHCRDKDQIVQRAGMIDRVLSDRKDPPGPQVDQKQREQQQKRDGGG